MSTFRWPCINQPFVFKHVFSDYCLEDYYLISVPNKLIIVPSKKCRSQIVKDNLCVEPDSFAEIHYKESCLGRFINSVLEIYASFSSKDNKLENKTFCHDVKLIKNGNQFRLEKKNSTSDINSIVLNLKNKEDVRTLLIQLNDIFLYPVWQNPWIIENITSFIENYCQNNTADFYDIKNSKVDDIFKYFDKNLSELKKIELYYKIYHNVHILAIYNHIRNLKKEPKLKRKSVQQATSTVSDGNLEVHGKKVSKRS